MKVDCVDETLAVAEAECLPLHGFDFVVDALGDVVGHPMSEVGDDALEVLLHALGRGDDGLEARVGGPAVPLIEELAGVALIGITPEVAEVFLDGPGADRFQVVLAQFVEARLGFGREIFGPVKSGVARAF